MLAVLVLALALRLKGVGWGLPFSFVNADESVVVPKAFGVARGGLNPQFFYYPSLFFYLVGGVYLLAAPVWWLLGHGSLLSVTSFVVDPGPYFLLARLFSVAAGTASVYLLYRIGREAFGRPAGLVAALFLAVAPLHVAYSHMAVTDVTAVAFSLLALSCCWPRAPPQRRRRPPAPAPASAEPPSARAPAAGSSSAPWPRASRRPPSTTSGRSCCRRPSPRCTSAAARWGAASRPAAARRSSGRGCSPCACTCRWLAAFLLASPFIVLDAPRFVRDFARQNRIMDRGWLGFENVGNGFWYNLTPNLTGALGVVLLVLGSPGSAGRSGGGRASIS